MAKITIAGDALRSELAFGMTFPPVSAKTKEEMGFVAPKREMGCIWLGADP